MTDLQPDINSLYSPLLQVIRWAGSLSCLGYLILLPHQNAIAQTAADLGGDIEVHDVPSASELLDIPSSPSPEFSEPELSIDWSSDSFPAETDPSVLNEDWANETGDWSATDDFLALPDALPPTPSAATPYPAPAPYIDESDAYNLGATQPTVIVLDERSTGCQSVLSPGDLLSGHPCTTYPSASQPFNNSTAGNTSNSWNLGPISVNQSGVGLNPEFSFDLNQFFGITAKPNGVNGNNDTALLFPLSIPAPITSFFGWRVHPIFGDERMHTGTDLGAPMGTPVVAAFSGNVISADFMDGYGLTVILQHYDGTLETLYAHLSEVFVQAGTTVRQGEPIGRVGSTGNSTGPHLHFEIREWTESGWVVRGADQVLQTALVGFSGSLDLASLVPISVPIPSSVASIEKTSASTTTPSETHGSDPFKRLLELGRVASKVGDLETQEEDKDS